MSGSLRPWTPLYIPVIHQGRLAMKPQIFREETFPSQWSQGQHLYLVPKKCIGAVFSKCGAVTAWEACLKCRFLGLKADLWTQDFWGWLPGICIFNSFHTHWQNWRTGCETLLPTSKAFFNGERSALVCLEKGDRGPECFLCVWFF